MTTFDSFWIQGAVALNESVSGCAGGREKNAAFEMAQWLHSFTPMNHLLLHPGKQMTYFKLAFAAVAITLFANPSFAQAQSFAQLGTRRGAVAGAIIGGIIGGQNDEAFAGMVIGGLIGGAAGNAIGQNRDAQYYGQHFGGYPVQQPVHNGVYGSSYGQPIGGHFQQVNPVYEAGRVPVAPTPAYSAPVELAPVAPVPFTPASGPVGPSALHSVLDSPAPMVPTPASVYGR